MTAQPAPEKLAPTPPDELDWKDARWLVVDVETTGFSPVKDKIVELGAVPFLRGEAGPRMGQLVNPGRPIPWRVTKVHQITDDMVDGRPKIADIAERFLWHVHNAKVIAGYNFAFDHRMLAAELGSAWTDAIAGKLILDPYPWARRAFAKGERKLSALCKAHGIAPPDGNSAHWASTDCLMLGQLLWQLRTGYPDQLPQGHPLRLELDF